MIVMKFGGSSLESSAAIICVADIVKARLVRRPVVVVSAMGKTTNSLLAIAQNAAWRNRVEAMAQLGALEEFHRREANALVAKNKSGELETILDLQFKDLREIVERLCSAGAVSPQSLDAITGYGEHLSSVIVTFALEAQDIPAVHVDAQRVIVTDSNFTRAAPILPDTYQLVANSIRGIGQERVPVMGGFIGATRDGIPSTLGRGGSDFTASLVGAAIDAEEIQIWTDVDGLLTCDPKLVPDAHAVRTISFDEAAELAYFGAKVLHPATIAPAKEKNIPVLILNSRRPDARGTRITAELAPCANVLKSIACKRDITVVNIRSNRMLRAHGFLRRIFEAFDRFETSVDMVATSEVSVSLTIDDDRRLSGVCRELAPFAEVTVEKQQTILCAVGENIGRTPGVAARVFRALGQCNVAMISQGASRLNLGVVVASGNSANAAEALHREFFTELDPAVFD